MSSSEESLRDKTVEELRDAARAQGITGASEMRKDELVQALAAQSQPASPAGSRSFGEWVRDRSLGLLFLGLFLVSWIAQLIVQWYHFAAEQRDHEQAAEFWSGDFWFAFWQSTLENWQSEFLQLATFTIGAAYLVYKGSSESPDSDERMEAKLDALLKERGLDPQVIERQLPPKHQKG